MSVRVKINGEDFILQPAPDELLKDSLRDLGFSSVKCGCNTSNCGLCTVLLNKKAVLSCSVLTISLDGEEVLTLEGLREEAERFGYYLGEEGGEQCGFCSPGFILSVLSLRYEDHVDKKKIEKALAGNLCRCTGYFSQMRAVKKYLEAVSHEKTR